MNFVCHACSLHRYQWPSLCAVQQTASLPESSRPVHQLYLRRWQPGDHMAPEQNLRPQFPPVHTGGHRVRSHQSRGRAQDRPPEATDHPWQNPLQAQYPRPRVRALRHNVSDAQSGDAGPQRYICRLSVAFVRVLMRAQRPQVLFHYRTSNHLPKLLIRV